MKNPIIKTWQLSETLFAKYDSSDGLTFLDEGGHEVEIRGLSRSALNKLFVRMKGVRKD